MQAECASSLKLDLAAVRRLSKTFKVSQRCCKASVLSSSLPGHIFVVPITKVGSKRGK